MKQLNTICYFVFVVVFYIFVQEASSLTHTFNLASVMPNRLSIMLSMSWFGIPQHDQQGPGPDPSYANWEYGSPPCIVVNNPDVCNTDVTPTPQRWVASKRRPLAGIYSASGRDKEGLSRIDLMLSCVRRGCNDDAKIDAWSVQIDSIRFTSRYPSNPMSVPADIAYRALLGFYAEANKFNLSNIIMPGMDSTWYFHFGHDYKLGKCDDTAGNPKSNCLNAIQSDITDMLKISLQNPQATYKIQSKPVLLLYVDSQLATASQFNTIFENVRNDVNHDFYVIATTENPSFFESFDALCPWVNLGQWTDAQGSSTYAKASDWVSKEHAQLFAEVSKYPGRVVFGGVAPGFDDYTKDWGACKPREIPRDPTLLQAQIDYLISKKVKGVLLETWDDWTEGTNFEPDVVGGPQLLVQLRQLLGKLYGEPDDPVGDKKLQDRWISYGQVRNCSKSPHKEPPIIDLKC